MKKIALIVLAMALSACSSRLEVTTFEKTTTTTETGIKIYSHNMAVSNPNMLYEHIATIPPRVLNGKTLQSTGFAKKGNYAYVVYNTKGDEIRGGLDILEMTTPSTPVLKNSLVSENSEYAEVKVKGNYLLMVGQKKDVSRNYGLLTVINVTDPLNPVVASELVFADGWYATSIDLEANKAYITVPNVGVKVVDISNLNAVTLLSTESSSAGNSFFVRRNTNRSIVLGGTSAHQLSSLQGGTTTLLDLISYQPQEAPARFRLKNNVLYTNGGNTGLNILSKINTSSPELKYSSPIEGRGNGLTTGSCHQLYLAQGEQGLLIYNAEDLGNPVFEGRFDYADAQEDCGSANNVEYLEISNNKYVFVSDGLGGVKIVKVNPTTDCNCDDQEDDDNSEDHESGLMCKVYDLQTQLSQLPNFSTLTPVGSFTTNQLDVVDQTWANSFPLFPTPLKYLTENYGVVCEGYWVSNSVQTIQVSLSSDDGSKLYLDNNLEINNDGLHAPQTVTKNINVIQKDYSIKIEYYQGPRTQIQLMLEYKPLPSGTKTYMTGFYH